MLFCPYFKWMLWIPLPTLSRLYDSRRPSELPESHQNFQKVIKTSRKSRIKVFFFLRVWFGQEKTWPMKIKIYLGSMKMALIQVCKVFQSWEGAHLICEQRHYNLVADTWYVASENTDWQVIWSWATQCFHVLFFSS